MSTIPKEERQKLEDWLIQNLQSVSRSNVERIINHVERYYYQLATDGREEFEKEIEGLKYIRKQLEMFCEGYRDLNELNANEVTALQSSLKEKEDEIKKLRFMIDNKLGNDDLIDDRIIQEIK